MNRTKACLVLAVLATLGTASPAWASLNTDLSSAAAGGDYNSVMTAVQLGANPNTRDRAGRTPLAWAARNNHPMCVGYLLAHGAYRDPIDYDGYTPLMWAARNGNFEVVALLINAGANPLVHDARGYDALALARMSREWRCEDMIYRYLHGEMVGVAPRAHRPNPGAVAPVAAAPTPAAMAAKPPAPTPAPSAAAAPAGPQEPNLLVKAMAIKKLAECGGRATQALDDFIKSANGNPMALVDPDVALGKEMLNFYANVGRTQSLVQARQDLTKVQAMWNGRTASHFTQNIKDADAVLKEAGL